MQFRIPKLTVLAAALLYASGAVAAGADKSGPLINKAVIEQEAGKTVYWVLPGPRRLSEAVFGTPDDPKRTLAQVLEEVDKPPIRALLETLPILVAAPEAARGTNAAGTAYTAFQQPTPFSDKARPLPPDQSGYFRTTLLDRVAEDQPGKPGNTPDEVELETWFHDPAGNRYRLEFDHVVQPPFPGYDTQGGVFTDGWLHGTTGTGSPLMPKEYTRGAWWGIVHLYINGEQVDTKVAHLMTTEVVRKRDYSLALDEEMPLSRGERHIPGQDHHTHLIVLPIKPTPQGPVFEPVKTAFELPNGQTQPFIHMMFEEDRIVEWELGGH
ncbi:hypothetical protein FEI13_02220 [Halomonas urmiana]|uniref:Uncharacterized protein n=1 Tax=Halomonas urmiana TaxID=490901 RepID=A0A5R8MMH1_9GAMM|nr:hypothetical protein [Halomonas urmiana]TLF53432.1 hypothetical protein FEI13_02220 [Halomonas urmiana]